MSARSEHIPVLCARCGAPAGIASDVRVTCPYCGHHEELPADLAARAHELRQRLYHASRAAANLTGFGASLVRLYEDRRVLLYTVLPYVGVLLVLALSAGGSLYAVVSHASGAASWGFALMSMAGPLGVLTLIVSTLGPTLFGRYLYRARVRPHLLCLPPRAPGAPSRCRVCGADLPPSVGPITACAYCRTQNLIGAADAHRAVQHAAHQTQVHRERLAAARQEVDRIQSLTKIAMPAGFVLTWIVMFVISALGSALMGG